MWITTTTTHTVPCKSIPPSASQHQRRPQPGLLFVLTKKSFVPSRVAHRGTHMHTSLGEGVLLAMLTSFQWFTVLYHQATWTVVWLHTLTRSYNAPGHSHRKCFMNTDFQFSSNMSEIVGWQSRILPNCFWKEAVLFYTEIVRLFHLFHISSIWHSQCCKF